MRTKRLHKPFDLVTFKNLGFPNALKYTLIFRIFKLCEIALKTKTSLKVRFRKKRILQNFFSTSSHIEKKLKKKQNLPEPCCWQVYVRERMWRVNYFSSMLNYGWKILIPNIVIPLLQFRK